MQDVCFFLLSKFISLTWHKEQHNLIYHRIEEKIEITARSCCFALPLPGSRFLTNHSLRCLRMTNEWAYQKKQTGKPENNVNT